MHERFPVRFLLVAHLYHEHLTLEAEHVAGESQRASPLTGTGLRANGRGALALVVVRLGDSGIRLVRSRRRHTLVLIVDFRRGAEILFETAGADKRRGAPYRKNIKDFLGNIDPALGGHFLFEQSHGKYRSEVVESDRLICFCIHRRRRWIVRHKLGNEIVPLFRQLPRWKDDLVTHEFSLQQ